MENKTEPNMKVNRVNKKKYYKLGHDIIGLDISQSARLVLIYMLQQDEATWSFNERSCASFLHISRNTVSKAISELMESGFILKNVGRYNGLFRTTYEIYEQPCPKNEPQKMSPKNCAPKNAPQKMSPKNWAHNNNIKQDYINKNIKQDDIIYPQHQEKDFLRDCDEHRAEIADERERCGCEPLTAEGMQTFLDYNIERKQTLKSALKHVKKWNNPHVSRNETKPMTKIEIDEMNEYLAASQMPIEQEPVTEPDVIPEAEPEATPAVPEEVRKRSQNFKVDEEAKRKLMERVDAFLKRGE